MFFILLFFTGCFLAMFAFLYSFVAVASVDRRASKTIKYFLSFLLVAVFALILFWIAITAPSVGEGRPDTSLIEEGRYQIVAVGQADGDKVELLLSDGEHGSRYYKLSMKKLGLEEVSEELEGQWLVVEKLNGYDYKIVPGK